MVKKIEIVREMYDMFQDLKSFLKRLQTENELVTIQSEVDPILEISEIAGRAVKENRPAILFENVKGSNYPVVVNWLASERRIELALGRHPSQISEELYNLIDDLNPPKIKYFWDNRSTIFTMLKNIRPKFQRTKGQLNSYSDTNLDGIPILKCWPNDAGRFITLPLVFTTDPVSNKANVGIYRMQVYDNMTTGLHMQIQKGGGFHYHNAEKLNVPLEVAVTIGNDPATLLSAIMPLPEGIDELMFAGLIRGGRTSLKKGESVNLNYPANSEFVLEGFVRPGRRREEGPFGDHFGHYSLKSPHPIFEITKILRKPHPIYAATVVGRPPQEDRYMGDAVQKITKPFIRLLRKEVVDLWAYFETGFHNLLVVAVEQRYAREALKTAYGIFGEGQLSLTKTLILVDGNVDPSDKTKVLQEIRRNFDSSKDFHLVSKTFIDTLDFTGESQHKGSKMIINATTYKEKIPRPKAVPIPANIEFLVKGIDKVRLIGNTLLVVQTKLDGKKIINDLVKHPLMKQLKIIVAVSDDIDIKNNTDLLWGIFTRFDPAIDVTFAKIDFDGIKPVYEGVMGIDATWKSGYPEPLKMDESVIRKVESNWDSYWN
ncbi:MAG: UbiD family decarboxylase [SAR202 cluster bacterium]|nr:UbiD family decarboxylase [SAR202 cluster bacterium]